MGISCLPHEVRHSGTIHQLTIHPVVQPTGLIGLGPMTFPWAVVYMIARHHGIGGHP
jgi:hypothetical protein